MVMRSHHCLNVNTFCQIFVLRGVVFSPQGSWADGLAGRAQAAVLKAWPAQGYGS